MVRSVGRDDKLRQTIYQKSPFLPCWSGIFERILAKQHVGMKEVITPITKIQPFWQEHIIRQISFQSIWLNMLPGLQPVKSV